MPELGLEIIIKARDEASKVFSSVGRAATSLRDRIGRLGTMAQVAGGMIVADLASKAASAVVDFTRAAVDGFSSLEHKISEVVAATGMVGEEAASFSSKVKEVALSLSSEFGVSATNVVEALEALVKAGLSGSEAMEALRSSLMLSKVEGISASESANLLVSTLSQFGLSARQASLAVDALTNASKLGIGTASEYAGGLSYVGSIAHTLGLSLQETLSALVLVDNTQKDAVKSGRYLNAMLSDLINHSDKLGFSLYDSSGKMLSLSAIISRLKARLSALATQEERNNYLQRVFGEQGLRAAVALLNQADSLKGLEEEMGKAGTTMEMFGTVMDTFQGRQERVRAEWERFQIEVGEALIPALEKLFSVFEAKLLPVLESEIIPIVKGPLSDALVYLVDPVLVGLIDVLGELRVQFVAFVKGWELLGSRFVSGLGMVESTFSSVMGGIELGLELVSSSLERLYSAWVRVWTGIAVALKGVYERTIAPIMEGLRLMLEELKVVPALGAPRPAPPLGVKRYGKGGLVSEPTLALVGESGPELILPLNSPSGRLVVDVYVHDDRIEFSKSIRRLV